jgi:alpha-ketoglutarate-dependent taurine dioxygenase
MTPKVRQIPDRFGARIDGIDLRDATDAILRGLLAAVLDHRFIVIPGQRLTNEDYVGFGSRWGRPVEFINRRGRLDGFPEMIVQSNRESTPEPLRDTANHWHCDSSYEAEVATFTMLYGIESPDQGGVTRFADLVAAYEALSSAERDRYGELRVLHGVAAATPMPDETIADQSKLPPENAKDIVRLGTVLQPLVAEHPVNRRRALYGLGGSAFGIEGMSTDAASQLLLDLRRHVTQERFCSSYKLLPGDVLLWDNFSVMHRATPASYSDKPGERRLNYRISVKGVPDFGTISRTALSRLA